ncbi:site-specific tyrosine recombinase XerC [Limihaloglobus sulfuriphilus]|uniref:Site-specific tyrosine recombinase XerC n=1 Tax=Limihaloglobus sulfuriphilus TaxID=1851148 RepID=A0A1Q2MFB8_9BACT|nr:site-specific integrase [Limihaloglobus sulfuriphilus]AQQ71393.1 site-specific tyrosine recombinase XerC [Limihaloglobus sulfuriphilus]
MAYEKVGVYPKWLEPVPKDKHGKPIARELWHRKRRHNWAVRWKNCHGKRYGKVFKTKKEAERFAGELQAKVYMGKADRPKKVSLRNFRLEHEKIIFGQVSYATYMEHKNILRIFEKFIGEAVELKNILPRDAEAFIADRLASNELSVSTVNKYLRTLKSIFNKAIDPRGYLPEGSNPFSRIKPRRVTDKPKRYVTIKEYLALKDAAVNKWWKTFIAVAYSSGLRLNEILHLTWNNIDFVNQRINVEARKSKDNIISWEPKGRRNRVVPIAEDAIKLLVDMQIDCPEGHPYIFITPERLQTILERKRSGDWHERSWVVNNVGANFSKIQKRAGIAKATIHDLRRSAITNWASALPFQAVHKLAGHSSISTTMGFYLSVREEDLATAGNLLDKMLNKELTQVTPK